MCYVFVNALGIVRTPQSTIFTALCCAYYIPIHLSTQLKCEALTENRYLNRAIQRGKIDTHDLKVVGLNTTAY